MVKPVIFFARLSGTKSEILEKTLMMFNGTCWQIYFRKKNSKREILDYLYFYLYYLYLFRFFFWRGGCFRVFQPVFFYVFIIGQPWRPTFLHSSPRDKKTSYGPDKWFGAKCKFILCSYLNQRFEIIFNMTSDLFRSAQFNILCFTL